MNESNKRASTKQRNTQRFIVFLVVGLFLIVLSTMMFRQITKNHSNNEITKKHSDTEVDSGDVSSENSTPENEDLTPEQQLLKEAGISFDTDVNWNLVACISATVEHEVGYNPDYYPGFDFDEIQQNMAAVVINRMNNADFPNTINTVLTQEGQFPGVWEYVCLNHSEVQDSTKINVLSVLYNNIYDIPTDIYFEYSFPYNPELTEPTDVGEYTPAVGSSTQAAEWLQQQGNISTGIYPYSSFVYSQYDGYQRLLIFCGSPTGPF